MGLLPTFREHWAVLQPRLLTLYSSAREKEVLLLLPLICSRADVARCAGARSDTVESWMSSGGCTYSAHNFNSITCQAKASQIFPPCKPEGFLDSEFNFSFLTFLSDTLGSGVPVPDPQPQKQTAMDLLSEESN